MPNALQTVLWLVTQSFAPRHNAQIRFLKAQVAILRKRVGADRIVPTPQERFELLRLSSEFGHQVGPLLEIVTLPTYRRWINDAKRGKNPKKSGRPRLSQELRQLVVRLAEENVLWGYRRIVGELKKLGQTIATSSVRRILHEHRIHPTPEKTQKREPPLAWEQFLQAHMESLIGSEFFTRRHGGEKAQKRQPPMPWAQFLQTHMESLVACDFFTKPVHTLRGRFDALCLVFIHLKSRRVFCSPATFQSTDAWMMQQARNAAMWMQEQGIQPRMLIPDHDVKFTLHFRQFWKDIGIRPKQIPFKAPQANAFVESFIANLKGECLNHFIIFSLSQMNYVVGCWTTYYNTLRPHRGKDIGNRVLDPDFKPLTTGVVCCQERLGGLIRRYYRAAA